MTAKSPHPATSQYGAHVISEGTCRITVWAPFRKSVQLILVAPEERVIPLERDAEGCWTAVVSGVGAGARYLFRLDQERDRPDPASRFQPDGVHGPSEIVDQSAFPWSDQGWRGIPLAAMILYELHPGTFTPEGTFDAVIPRLADLKELGVNAIELMPVAQFPGSRNWGYDGVYPYAVQNSYGGPEGLKRLVNACHRMELAVVLDVVYNHLGPEGNYLWDYGPYFTDRYRTPWGDAVNFDGPYSDSVRRYFIENALHWIRDYHVDALRVDAIHNIFDFSARHFLQELGEAVHLQAQAVQRSIFVMAESDLNDTRAIRPRELGGEGLDTQWSDDFHHCLHTLLTGEQSGYYEDFGKVEQMEKAFREGFVYSGGYSAFRKRRHGNDSRDRPAHQFIVFSQNHDQVGNRMMGDRLTALVSFEALKLAAGAVILSSNIPLLFMGEEYGEDAPFLYFVSHSDPGLIEAVRTGRKEEFQAFSWEGEPPDPQSEETFRASKLDWGKRGGGRHQVLSGFYRNLLQLRKRTPALAELDKAQLDVRRIEKSGVIALRRWSRLGASHAYCLYNFETSDVNIPVSLPAGSWRRSLDSSDAIWSGPGSLLPPVVRNGDHVTLRGQSVALFLRESEQ
jgi:maltooligosyltrehalose trehalohydrolase